MINDGNDNGSAELGFDYDLLVEDALKNVVKKVLKLTAEKGLIGNSHFFISFNGNYSNVIVPDELKNDNSSEIKIIIQHQFWDLISTDDHFEVTLSFNGERKKISIPYNAITSFNDPSVGFGLQFKLENGQSQTNKNNDEQVSEISLLKETVIKDKDDDNIKSGEIVSLDAFRDKK